MSNRLYFQESRAEARAVIHRLLDDEIDALDPRAHLERLIPNQCPECKSTNVTDADDEGLIDCMDCGIWFNPLHPNNAPGSEFYGKPAPRIENLDDELDPLGYASGTVNGEAMARELGFDYEGKSNPGSDGIAKDIWSKPLDASVEARMNYGPDPTVVSLFLYGRNPRTGGCDYRILQRHENVPVNKVREMIQRWQGLPQRWDAQDESLEDEIPDLKAYVMQHGETPRICITFSRTTPESAEQGDFSETGWIDEEGVDMTPDEFDRDEGITAVDKAVDFLRDAGATEHSCSAFDSHGWYSSGWSTTDYGTGEEEERNFHLKGFLPGQLEEVYNKLMAKRR